MKTEITHLANILGLYTLHTYAYSHIFRQIAVLYAYRFATIRYVDGMQ